MWEGGGGQDEVAGGGWDNCNSIINKYIEKEITLHFPIFPDPGNFYSTFCVMNFPIPDFPYKWHLKILILLCLAPFTLSNVF